MSCWAALCTTFALAMPVAPSPPDTVEGSGWKLLSLDLDVTVLPAEKTLRFSGRARLRLERDSSLGPALGMNTRRPVLRFTRATAAGATVVLNDSIPGDSAVRVLRLRLAQPARRGAEIETAFEYEMVGTSSQLLVQDSVALASWVENWYPAPLTEDGFTQTAASAPGVTRFHLPKGWRAVSNGTLATKQAKPNVDAWTVTQPVARSFAAAPFTVAVERTGGRDVGMYLLTTPPAAARTQARTLSRALTAMERRFGPYPYPSYLVAEVPESSVTWAASSEQGFIMAISSMFDAPGGNLPLFAHEAAHGWWGNAVSTTGPGSRMGSEALAQYGAVVAIEALEGKGAMRDFLDFSRPGYNPLQCALGYFHIWREGEDNALAALDQGPSDHNLADSKGMWFYHMVRQRIGDTAFFAALKASAVRLPRQAHARVGHPRRLPRRHAIRLRPEDLPGPMARPHRRAGAGGGLVVTPPPARGPPPDAGRRRPARAPPGPARRGLPSRSGGPVHPPRLDHGPRHPPPPRPGAVVRAGVPVPRARRRGGPGPEAPALAAEVRASALTL